MEEGGTYYFEGYDLGSLRIQISGKTSFLYAPDGNSVKIYRTQWLYKNGVLYSEFNKNGHCLSIYSNIDPPGILEEPFTFHLTVSSGLLIVFARRTYISTVQEENKEDSKETEDNNLIEESLLKVKSSLVSAEDKKKKKSNKSSKQTISDSVEEPILLDNDSVKLDFEDVPKQASISSLPSEPSFEYDLRIVWPSSLTIETVVRTDENDPFYIKQHYLTKGPECDRIRQEICRCYLRNGNVLVFKIDGSVIILTSNGTIYYCTEFEAPVPPEPPHVPTPPQEEVIPVEEKKSKKQKSKPEQPKSKKGGKGKKEKSDNDLKVLEEQQTIDEATLEPPPLPPPPSPLWKITEYEVVTDEGKRYIIKNDEIITLKPYLVRTATDYEVAEVFTRREDGTNTLANDDRLTTTYPDGTRIYSYAEEQHSLFEWSEDEIKEMLDAAGFKVEEEFLSERPSLDMTTFRSTSVMDVPQESVEGELPEQEEEQVEEADAAEEEAEEEEGEKEKKIDFEPYVVINMFCEMEHPNYANVKYDGVELSAVICSPDETDVRVNKDGTYEASLTNETTLSVNKWHITFESSAFYDSLYSSKTKINLSGFEQTGLEVEITEDGKEDTTFSCSTDSWGNELAVYYDGEVKHAITGDGEVPQQYVVPQRHVRLFMLNRDLSGVEFVHKDDVDFHLVSLSNIIGATRHHDAIPGTGELNYYTTFIPLTKTESQKWLMPINTKSHIPVNLKRKDLTRSTYGDPPTWSYPFPKNTKAKQDSRRVSTLKYSQEIIEETKVLLMRVLEDLEPSYINILDCIQGGIIAYWKEVKHIFEKYKSFEVEDTRTPEEIEIEQRLLDVAMSQTPRSVINMYLLGLKAPATPTSPDEFEQHKAEVHQMYMENFKRKKEEEKEDTEFYRNLWRTKNVPNYFSCLEGDTFIKVLDTVHESVDISEYKCTEDHVHNDSCTGLLASRLIVRNIIEKALPSIGRKYEHKKLQVDIIEEELVKEKSSGSNINSEVELQNKTYSSAGSFPT